MSSAAEKANLARIRDNQRRSRARRKEYLQELEARLHQCELQGIEASAEIQHAARRVADENRKLRILLSRHGVADESVNAFLGADLANIEAYTVNGTGGGQAVQILDHLLTTKRCVSTETGTPQRTTIPTGSRDSSAEIASGWQPVFNGSNGQSHNHSTASTPVQQQVPFLTPSSSGGRMSITSQSDDLPTTCAPQRGGCCTTSRSSNSNGNGNLNSNPVTLPSQAQYQASNVAYGFNTAMMAQPQHSQNNAHYTSQQHQQHYQNQQHPQSRSLTKALSSSTIQPVYIPSTSATSIGTNSCVYATDMISTLTGEDPSTVREDLGCGPAWGRQVDHCEVDNRVVFNVLDRYTSNGPGGMTGMTSGMGVGL